MKTNNDKTNYAITIRPMQESDTEIIMLDEIISYCMENWINNQLTNSCLEF